MGYILDPDAEHWIVPRNYTDRRLSYLRFRLDIVPAYSKTEIASKFETKVY